MPHVPMLLVNPGVPVPTRDVFAALETRSGVEMKLPRGAFQDTADLLRFLDATRNDLEAPALKLQPVIGEVLAGILRKIEPEVSVRSAATPASVSG